MISVRLMLTVTWALLIAGCAGSPRTIGEGRVGTGEPGPSSLEPSSPPSTDAESNAVQVLASHSSARLVATGYGISSVRLNHSGQATEIIAGNGSSEVLLPFLEPQRSYTASVDLVNGTRTAAANVSFATSDTPFPMGSPADAWIYPGAAFGVGVPPPGCTLAFIARDATNSSLYGFTAAHCFDGPDDDADVRMESPDGLKTVGHLALYHNEGEVDWAIIRIDNSLRAAVAPNVEHWTGPSGAAGPLEAKRDDPTCHVGNGGLFNSRTPSGAPAAGTSSDTTPCPWRMAGER
jgi:hypothetical protein